VLFTRLSNLSSFAEWRICFTTKPPMLQTKEDHEKKQKERRNLIKQITRYPKHLKTAIEKQNQNN
jgi:arginyl-tRNA synthetase